MDITHLFGGPIYASDDSIASPEEQLRQVMLDAGVTPPPALHFDDILYRYSTNGKKDDDAGWYVAHNNIIPCGAFGDWRSTDTISFRGNIGRSLTPAENLMLEANLAEAKRLRDLDKKKRNDEAAEFVQILWDASEPAPADFPYLVRKGVKPHDSRIGADGRLLLPMYNAEGTMTSLQYINEEGKKLYHPGGAVGASGWMLGSMVNAPKVYLAEGYATAATIFEETGRPVFIAYSAGNLPAMAQMIRAEDSEVNIVIVADNDHPNPNTGDNTGLKQSEKAASLAGGKVVMPPLVGQDANDFKMAGGNLKELLGENKSRMTFIDDMSEVPSPVSWLVKGWVQEKAMVMLHGPSGCGKSFVVLDWMCTIASGQGQWLDKTTKTGDVIYLCGEGHHGLRARAKAWKIDHNMDKIGNIVVSNGPSDLDKLEDLNQVVQDIVDTGVEPKLIVIDTLNRFMSGDENSAKETRAFLDACSKLMQKFDCTVLIVHHTGLNQEAQERARGSSAWKGAMDIEISVRPTRDGLVLSMTKSKDTEAAEPLSLALKRVDLPGWFDEDDEQVSSAVIIEGKELQQPKDLKLGRKKTEVRLAWEWCGKETREDKPYIEKKNWINYQIAHEKKKPANARTILSNNPQYLAGMMILNNVIKVWCTGFLVIDPDMVKELLV